MKKILLIIMAAAVVTACNDSTGNGSIAYVDPFIGTAFTGHTFPGAAAPFGFIQAGPQTGNLDWRYCGGYNFEDKEIQGFTQNRISGTGCPDLGDILIMPFSGREDDCRAGAEERKFFSRYDKGDEIASPGYYRVKLEENDVDVEITCSEHTAMYRASFGGSRKLFIDFQNGTVANQRGLDRRVNACEIGFEDDSTISGHISSTCWVKRDMYFVMQFDSPVLARESWLAKPEHRAPKYLLDFGGSDKPLMVKIALSSRSIDGAKNNLLSEMPGWDFGKARRNVENLWKESLSILSVKGTEDQKISAFTALYHLLLQPNIISDCGEEPEYSTFSLWDTFRAAHPFYSLFIPEKNSVFVDSMLKHCDRQGFLPIWALWGIDNFCMIGNHAVPVVVEAALNGVPGIDAERVYASVRKSLTEDHYGSSWGIYDRYGYYPFDLIGSSVAKTLESGYDDWCAAQLAAKLGKIEDYEFFIKRAGYFKNLYDSGTGFMRGKDSDGCWREPFSPFVLPRGGDCGNDYVEGNAWQYTWHCIQDIPALIDLIGGKEQFIAKLDSLYAAEAGVDETGFVLDVTGLIGQYAHGNEPSHHIAYLYGMAGRPDRTAEIVREIFDRFYLNKPDGLCGNDDCGQMSAWYLFSAMGFYPVNTVTGEFVLGAPQIPYIKLALPNGKTFTVLAENLSAENKYVGGVTLNGKPLDGIITRDQILAGGILKFSMIGIPMSDPFNSFGKDTLNHSKHSSN